MKKLIVYLQFDRSDHPNNDFRNDQKLLVQEPSIVESA